MLKSATENLAFEFSTAIVSDLTLASPEETVLEVVVQLSQTQMGSRSTDGTGEATSAWTNGICIVQNQQLLGILTEEEIVQLGAQGRSLDQVKLGEAMRPPLETLKASDIRSLDAVIERFQSSSISSLPVIGDQNEFIGLITEKSLKTAALLQLQRRPIREVLTGSVAIVSPDTSLLTIAQMMTAQQCRYVLVCELNHQSVHPTCGVVTILDLMQSQVQGLDLQAARAHHCMRHSVMMVNGHESLGSLKQTVQEQNISHLVVLGKHHEIQGVVTQAHLLESLKGKELQLWNARLEQSNSSLNVKGRSHPLALSEQSSQPTLAVPTKREQLFSSVAAKILSSLSLQEILDTTVDQVRQFLQCDRVNIWQLQPDYSVLAVAESFTEPGMSRLQQSVTDLNFQAEHLLDYWAGHIRVINDMDEGSQSDCHRELLAQFHTRAQVLVPILSGDQLWGLLNVGECEQPRQWQPEEISLLKDLAVHLGIAIQQATAYAQLQAKLKEQQLTEIRLRESEHRYATLADAVPVGIFRTNAIGEYLYVNESWSLITGLSQAQALGNGWWSSVHPEDRDLFKIEWLNAVMTNQPFRMEFRFLHPNGTINWVYGQALEEKDSNGTLIGYVGTVTDITEHKQMAVTLNNLVEGTATVTGKDFFPAMVRHIAIALDVNCAIVSQFIDGTLHVLASWSQDHHPVPASYHPAKTPCEYTLKQGQYICTEGVQQEFPKDLLLVDWELESYFGMSLQNEKGQPMGLLCILDKKPLQYPKRTEKLLQVFAARASVELERKSAIDALHQLNQSLESRVEQRTRELREQEAQLQDFFENANDLIQSVSIPDGAFESVNLAWRRTLGYHESEVENLTIWTVLHPSCREKFQSTLTQIQMYGSLSQNQIELTFLDSQNREVLVEGSLDFRFEGDRPVAQRAIFRNITERKKHENALKESQQLLQTVLDAFPLYVFWKNQASEYMGGNQNFIKAAGFSHPDEITGKTDYDMLWANSEADKYRADDRQVMDDNTEKLGIIETQLNAEGQKIWVETNKVPLHDLQGEVMGVLGTYQDISDRKHAEEALKQQSAAIEAAVDGIAILKNNQYLYLNQAHISLLGYRHLDELKGQNWEMFYQPEQLEWFETEVFPKLAQERYWRGETIACRNDGSTFAQELSLTLTDEELLICVCRDITERKEYEFQLQQKNLELARATRLKDEFLANMSHELRTPLNAILGMSEALQEGIFGDVNDKQNKALATIERSGTHLLELISDILDLSKIEAGQVKLNLEPTAVEPLCQASLSFIKQQAQKKKIRLSLDVVPHLPKIDVDQRRLRQILINLLNNAVKFTPEGGQISLMVTMEFSSHLEQNQWVMRFAISDTGIGISKSNLASLFQPFVQIDSALNRKYDGTGLGLSLVKQIVDLHGGTIAALSQEGIGSTFIVDLPCINYDQPENKGGSIPEHEFSDITQMPTQLGVSNRRILLVEDNNATVMTISSYLKAKNYCLQIASNGYEALECLSQETPDLIIMDIQMSEMDGIEAIQRIREQESFSHIPIIALTALAMVGDRERCLKAGASDYLTKPVKLKQLAMKIESLLKTQEGI